MLARRPDVQQARAGLDAALQTLRGRLVHARQDRLALKDQQHRADALAMLDAAIEAVRPVWVQTDAEDLARLTLPPGLRVLPVFRTSRVVASISANTSFRDAASVEAETAIRIGLRPGAATMSSTR